MNPLRPGAGWTPERVAILNQRVQAGKSASEIARELRVSRNAVIGKATRLGLALGGSPASSPQSRSRHEAAKTPNRQPAAPLRAIGPSKTSANPFGRAEVSDVRARIQRQEKVKAALANGAPLPPFAAGRRVPSDIAVAPRPWVTRNGGECTYLVTDEGADSLACCNPVDRRGFCTEHARWCLTKTYGGEEGWPVRAARRVA